MAIPLLLQPQSLLGLYEKYASEAPSALLQWFPDRPMADQGQNVQYDTVQYSQDIAAINVRFGEPNVIKPVARGSVMGMAITLSEQVPIPAQVIKDLRGAGSTTPDSAAIVVAREMKNLRLRIGKRKALFAAQCLGTASGNLSFTLPGGASAETVSLNYTGSHQAIGSAWQTATTDIIANILTAKGLIALNGGKQATDMVLNSVTGAYLSNNDNIMDLLTDVTQGSVLQTGEFTRLANLNIHYVDEVYVNDVTAAATKLIPDNHVVILAGDNSDRGMIETQPASLHAPDSARGLFFHVVEDPEIKGGIKVQYTYSFFPLLANPDEVVYDTTVAA